MPAVAAGQPWKSNIDKIVRRMEGDAMRSGLKAGAEVYKVELQEQRIGLHRDHLEDLRQAHILRPQVDLELAGLGLPQIDRNAHLERYCSPPHSQCKQMGPIAGPICACTP